ncbi:MAG TPA: PAS domain S-box protein [Methylobacterium sp.]|jgi:PAS domain S-box-containing protein|nr:PAS domain S-box protein [Methylobacterium sp.]
MKPVIPECDPRSQNAYAITDLDGRFIQADARYAEILDFPLDVLLTKNVSEVTHPEDWQANARLIEDLVRHGRPFRVRKRYLRRGGHAVWVEVRAAKVSGCDAGGSLIAICRPLPVTSTPILRPPLPLPMREVDLTVLRRAFDRIAESRALLDRTERWLR